MLCKVACYVAGFFGTVTLIGVFAGISWVIEYHGWTVPYLLGILLLFVAAIVGSCLADVFCKRDTAVDWGVSVEDILDPIQED